MIGLIAAVLSAGIALAGERVDLPVASPPIDQRDTAEIEGVVVRRGTTVPLTGTVISRHPNGRLQMRRSVVEGRADGVWMEWFETGGVKFYAEWRMGKGHGSWVYFYPNGELQERAEARDDIWNGVAEGWHDNGVKAFESTFTDGVRLTPVRRWDKDGVAVGPWTSLTGAAEPRAVLDVGWPESTPLWDFSFTPDLETLFVATGQADGAGRRILIRRWRNGAWTVPEPAPFARVGAAEGTPVMSPDGRHIYFSSDRHRVAEPGNPYRDLYRASAASGWTAVERVTSTPAYGEIALSLSKGGTGVMWTDRRTDGATRMGLYQVRFDEAAVGGMTSVTVTGDLNDLHPNDPSNENSAAIAPDGRFVIFANYNVTGQDTGEDLFVTFKDGARWSRPVALGQGVNTVATESSPQLLDDATLAWRYEGPDGSGIRVIALSAALKR